MWYLIGNELRMLRSYFLQIFAFIAVAIVVFRSTAPQVVITYFTVFPIVMAMTLPQISFTQEERGKTFVFLRSLPVKPASIVGAKYSVSLVVIVFFLCLMTVGHYMFPDLGLTMAQASIVTILSALASSVSYFLHFMMGLKSAKIALLGSLFAVGAPAMLLSQNPRVQAWFGTAQAAQLFAIANSATGVLMAVLAACIILSISFTASAAIFTRRDVSQIP